MILLSASKVRLWVQRDGGMWSFLTCMDQKSCVASPASGSKSWDDERDPSDSPRKSLCSSPRIGWSRIQKNVLSSPISPNEFYSSICNWKNTFSLFFGKYHLFRNWVFLSRFPMRPSSPTPQGLQPVRHPSKFLACNAYPRNNPSKTFFPNWWILDWSFAVVRWYSTNEPNVKNRSFKQLLKTSFIGRFPIR